MSESKKQGEHTPGPWTAYELGNEDGTWRKWSIVHNGPIAYGGDNGKGAENSKATAQLMAAAPELLAALELLAIWRDGEPCFCHIHSEGAPMNYWLVPPHRHEDYCRAARAAIAKARGAV